MMRWTMSTSLSVRGETCSRISQRSNRKVSSVFEPLVSIFPVHSIFEYYIDRNVFTSHFRVDVCNGMQVFSAIRV